MARWFTSAWEAYTWLRERKNAYTRIPAPVIADLAEFTRAYGSCFDKDPLTMARLEGRRDVWLHIAKHTKLTDDELFQQATGGLAAPTGQTTEENGNVRTSEYSSS